MKLVIQQLAVRATRERVFELFTDPEQFGQWMAEGAALDATPGGVVRWTHPNGDTVSGRYVEVDPPRRIVFTYGWERADVGIPPGSTTVEIDLTSQADGTTLVKLVHRGLDDGAARAHDGGWTHYLDRLRRNAEGDDVGADPWADRCVPSRAERRR
ncbi:SRPBCC domain-containing protein [Mycobacterium sp. E3198]|uniref:SRPBCC family protein n=1 Tax=Mycobacterium sp. E3198 TaxID=1834143 RepID=UPI0007FCAEFE|nr:SRPBCC family protein [Mycobacterium sp. E3198]OBG35182.1 ATPase [Mycobacterium sp. E3198]